MIDDSAITPDVAEPKVTDYENVSSQTNRNL